MYDTDATGTVDHILSFSEIPHYDPNFYSDMLSWEDTYEFRTENCECGAIYTSFPAGHMFFCKKWSKF